MTNIGYGEIVILVAEIGMTKEGQDCHDLVLMSEGRDERTHGSASTKVMKQLQLILDPKRAAGHVYLLQRNVSRLCSLVTFHSSSLRGGVG